MPNPHLLATTALVLSLAGCGATAPQPATVVAPVPDPVAVTIPAIGAQSDLDPVGLAADGALQVPPVTDPMQAAWFEPGPEPGEQGPAVVLAHVSGRPDGAASSVPGLFARLADLRPGDEVLIERVDGSTARFDVFAVDTFDKGAFPTAAVYGDTPGPELRLITCGGEFDSATRSYRSNVVVFARIVEG